MCCRAFTSGSGMYILLSNRRRIACKRKQVLNVKSKWLSMYILNYSSPDQEHMEYLWLQGQELYHHYVQPPVNGMCIR